MNSARHRILLLTCMRENSERLPEKMLRRIGGAPLATIALKKIRAAAQRFAMSASVALCPTDARLVALAHDAGIPIFERTVSSRNGETYEQVYKNWDKAFADFDWVIVVNPCMPFLRIETIGQAIDATRSARRPVASIFRSRGCVWDYHHRLVIGKGLPNTKKNPEFSVLAHAFFCYPSATLGHPAMTQYRSFSALERGMEFLDIDTMKDLTAARAWARYHR